MKILNIDPGTPLTYLLLSEREARQIPDSIKHSTRCEGEYMILANEEECKLLERISDTQINLMFEHDFLLLDMKGRNNHE